MKLKPIGKNIIFKFLEEVSSGGFVPSSGGLIQLVKQNLDHNREPKWGKVMLCGPLVDTADINVGEYILVEPLQWTPGFEVDGVMCWKTDATKIMMVSSKVPDISF